MIGIAFLILTAVTLLAHLLFRVRVLNFVRIVRFSKTVPGPSIRETIANSSRDLVLPFLLDCAQKYGSRFAIWLSRDYYFFATTPEDMRILLSSQELITKAPNYFIMRPWLGDGLLLAGGDKWQRTRKFLTPAFHFNILRQFKGAMTACCESLTKKLEAVADGKPVNIYPFVTLFALDVICETALGVKKNAQEESESEYVQAVQGMCGLIHHRTFNFWLRNDAIYRFSRLRKKEHMFLDILHRETDRVIEERRKKILAWNIESTEQAFKHLERSEDDDGVGTKKRLAFLDMLLIGQLEGKGITNAQIRDEVETFMFEGHDTTSSAISFALYALSRHPACQERAYAEAVEYMGREQDTMKYMEAVIKETLRLFPAVPIYSRGVMKDFKMGDQLIPEGVNIMVFAYALHRNPDLYPDPDEFRPERHLIDVQQHPYSFVAFSAGPRNCIGQKFAMLEMKTTLSHILRKFKFGDAHHKPILLAELILKSENGVRVTIQKRSPQSLS